MSFAFLCDLRGTSLKIISRKAAKIAKEEEEVLSKNEQFSVIMRKIRSNEREKTPTDMNPCHNCGKLNAGESNFCRFCGTKFTFQQTAVDNPYDYSAPRPYSWKTDEFQTQNEPRKTLPINRVQPLTNQLGQATPNYQPQHLAYPQSHQMTQPFRCPHCMSQYLPRLERRISTAGWITFAVLLVFFFPLFWIGLLIKEDVQICQSCNTRIG